MYSARLSRPEFTTQTKQKLGTPAADLGVDFGGVPKNLKTKLKDIGTLQVLAQLKESADERAALKTVQSGSSDSRQILRINKLVDAFNAGKQSKGFRSTKLIVTEGDSAKALALAGASSTVDAKNWGVFPLRGKVMNVFEKTRAATIKKCSANAELCSLIKILGLDFGETFEDPGPPEARYSNLWCLRTRTRRTPHHRTVLTVHRMWPNLLLKHNFVMRFITPVLKLTLRRRDGVLLQ